MQLKGETAEQFIMELYSLADSCEYSNLKDEMIHDRLVVGIHDDVLSQQLQLDPELTLDKASSAPRGRRRAAKIAEGSSRRDK